MFVLTQYTSQLFACKLVVTKLIKEAIIVRLKSFFTNFRAKIKHFFLSLSSVMKILRLQGHLQL